MGQVRTTGPEVWVAEISDCRRRHLQEIKDIGHHLNLTYDADVRNLLVMKFWLCIGLLACCAVAQAEPPASADDMDRMLVEKGLINRIGGQIQQVRESVGERASELVVNAMGFLGVPYRRGGNSAETGFDCSGFVRAMYEQTIGHVLPRRADQQAAATQVIERKDLRPGDLVFFNTMRRAFSHVGIYVGEDKFIHSPRSGSQVRIEDMQTSYWRKRFNGARRVAVDAQDPPASSR